MAVKSRDTWFYIFLAVLVVFFMGFAAIVAISPHNDAKMRGFTPCTLELADELSSMGGEGKIWGVLGAVGKSYLCYAGVIRQSTEGWLKGQLPTPWAGYLFEPEVVSGLEDEESAEFYDELNDANLLDDAEDGEEVESIAEEIKENTDEQ